jgi:hypothetical protein
LTATPTTPPTSSAVSRAHAPVDAPPPADGEALAALDAEGLVAALGLALADGSTLAAADADPATDGVAPPPHAASAADAATASPTNLSPILMSTFSPCSARRDTVAGSRRRKRRVEA